jgi:hypothetical protein
MSCNAKNRTTNKKIKMTTDKSETKERVFKIVQDFLKKPPLIVWGSGATISFGLPSMEILNETLKKKIDGFDNSNNNLEIELGKAKYLNKMPQIKNIIWNKINEADISVLDKIATNNTGSFKGIKLLIEKFIEAHPQVLNIVTTNYDRVLEYTMAYEGVSYTDGFEGKILSSFDENLFQSKNIINLIKVHGSLNWFNVNGEIRYLNNISTKHQPQIIAPGRNKYQEAYRSPYRELIQKADNAINEASSFLVVGFGFNDEHLTPRIRTQIKKGIPIVLITKEITESTLSEIKGAEKYLLIEELDTKTSRVIYKSSNSTEEQSVELEGNYWQLSQFMEIL